MKRLTGVAIVLSLFFVIGHLPVIAQGTTGNQYPPTQPGTSGNQNGANNQPLASETAQPESMSTSMQSTKQAPQQPQTDLVQNEQTSTLEKAILTFNQNYCPPERPITQLSQDALIKLYRAELIKGEEVESFSTMDMVLVDGKVFQREKKEEPKPEPEPQPRRPKNGSTKSLFGAIESASEEIEQNKTRGKTDGNKKPEQTLTLKRRKIIYRDLDNKLQEMEMHSPPKFPAKKKRITGKRFKKIRDYTTTILVPKAVDGEKSDVSAFEDMPSAETWIGDGPVAPSSGQ